MNRNLRSKLSLAAMAGLAGTSGQVAMAAIYSGPMGTSGSPAAWYDDAVWGGAAGATPDTLGEIAQFNPQQPNGDYYLKIDADGDNSTPTNNITGSIRFPNIVTPVTDYTGKTYTFTADTGGVYTSGEIREVPANATITFNAPVSSPAGGNFGISIGAGSRVTFNQSVTVGSILIIGSVNGGIIDFEAPVSIAARTQFNPGTRELIVGTASSWDGRWRPVGTSDNTISFKTNWSSLSGDKRTDGTMRFRGIDSGEVTDTDRTATLIGSFASSTGTPTILVAPNGAGYTGNFTLKLAPPATVTQYATLNMQVSGPSGGTPATTLEFSQASGITQTLPVGFKLLDNPAAPGGKVRVSGPGTLIINSVNSDTITNPAYTGGTTIADGKLQLGVSDALPDIGLVKVGSTATVSATAQPGVLDLFGFNDTIGSLGGSGTVKITTGNTLTASGGVQPGASAGILHISDVGTLAIGATSSSIFELGAPDAIGSDTNFDDLVKFDSTGSLSILGASTAQITVADAGGLAAGTYILFDLSTSAAPISGAFNPVATMPSGFAGVVSNDTINNDVILTVSTVPVPEPASLGMLGSLVAAATIRRRKHR